MRTSGRILPTETILDDDYPVYWGYSYLADGLMIECDIVKDGTVADLKRISKAKEIRRCDIIKRANE